MIENIAFFDFYLDNWRKVAIFAATITVWTMGCERHLLHIYDPEMWSPSILRRHKWSAVGLSVRTSLLFLYPNFVCRMAMGTKNAATLIRELRLVAPPRLELSQTEPKSGVLPLHHGAIGILRAQRYAIILIFPNFSGKIFRICAQFVWKCYVCCSKSLGSPYASMTLMT